MNDLPRRVLRDLIAEYGPGLAVEPKRTAAFLLDLCGAAKPEIFALTTAQNAGIVEELTTLATGMPVALRVAQLAGRLHHDLGLPDTTARWAIESWALALGAIDEFEATTDADLGIATPTRVPKRSPIVAADGSGDCRTIAEALTMIDAGARIAVRPGLYRERLTIDKPVELTGDGPRDTIAVEAAGGPCLFWLAPSGTVRGLTLRARGDGETAVDLAGGAPLLDDCAIVSRGVGITCHGPATRPVIRQCLVQAGGEGVSLRDGAAVLLDRNEITGQTEIGVRIAGASAVVRGNQIRGGRIGIAVSLAGDVLIDDNDLSEQTDAGILIDQDAEPTVRGNRIRDGRAVGIEVRDNGRGLIEANELTGHATAAVKIASGGDPFLRQNHLCDNAGTGLFAVDGGQGTIEACEFARNVKGGVAIARDADPLVRNSTIADNGGPGVVVYQNGRGRIETNEIHGNTGAGVAVTTGGEPTSRRNIIRDGKSSGLFVYQDGRGTFEEDELRGNANAGVVIAAAGAPTLRRCRIAKNSYVAVWLQQGAAGIIEDCDLRDNPSGPWHVHPGATTRRIGNRE